MGSYVCNVLLTSGTRRPVDKKRLISWYPHAWPTLNDKSSLPIFVLLQIGVLNCTKNCTRDVQHCDGYRRYRHRKLNNNHNGLTASCFVLFIIFKQYYIISWRLKISPEIFAIFSLIFHICARRVFRDERVLSGCCVLRGSLSLYLAQWVFYTAEYRARGTWVQPTAAAIDLYHEIREIRRSKIIFTSREEYFGSDGK